MVEMVFFLLFYNALDLNNQKILCPPSIYLLERKLGFWTNPRGDSLQKLLQKVFDPILQLKISHSLLDGINRYIFFFQIQTLGGEFITLFKNADTNKVKIFSQSGQSSIKVSNVKTKFGLVDVIDSILT